MSVPRTDFERATLEILLRATVEQVDEYKLEYLGMPVEASQSEEYSYANREQWVQLADYGRFIGQLLAKSGLRHDENNHSFSSSSEITEISSSDEADLKGTNEIIEISSEEVCDLKCVTDPSSTPVRPIGENEVIEISSDEGEGSTVVVLNPRKRRRPSTSQSPAATRKHRNPVLYALIQVDPKFRLKSGVLGKGVIKNGKLRIPVELLDDESDVPTGVEL